MDTTAHSLNRLFEQLGLPSTDPEIEQFIQAHRLDETVSILDADFWTDSQRQFLQESLKQDADWSPIVDDLNAMLHH
ncbi:MAG: DUF2789 domain-containing protein [Pseudomonadota bacterium]|nr:DUF2789 domain-containing protein [Pseudomonadota bacterium]